MQIISRTNQSKAIQIVTCVVTEDINHPLALKCHNPHLSLTTLIEKGIYQHLTKIYRNSLKTVRIFNNQKKVLNRNFRLLLKRPRKMKFHIKKNQLKNNLKIKSFQWWTVSRLAGRWAILSCCCKVKTLV